ncbi:ATPase [Halapricum desulfuricans]|uniref:Putative P-loop ATPase/GTPase n=1 Tax=Halapricum desulfuricans TaxID=2841257 RepID=A0A897NN26_9EURY|nr:ATPase [Halapricum desulfuricans]QSG09416.1 putative P-loop ATPase/GTPase [Halapricum desulfuricans]QSG12313.1 putative P-loop ATPase/GTPase [Halapricum desulfuricans]
MNLLVAGSEQLDAGKTTFSVGLVERTGAVGYKPRAGNDFWYSHDDVRTAAEDGVLYGKDARRLAAAGPDGNEPTDINAVHRLWRPLPGGVGGVLEQDGREFLLDRAGETYVVNGTTTLPAFVRSSFPIASAISVESLAEFNDVMASYHQPIQSDLLAEIEAQPLSVVESYGAIARPLSELDHDAVAVVEPRRVRVYDGRRYDKGCSIAGGSPGPDRGTLEERVADVTDLIDPVETVELPPLPESVRHDPAAIADAYESAYDAMLSAAGS